MTVTLDTHVLVAAFISRGVCHDLFEYLCRHHTVVTSEYILDEFRNALVNKLRFPKPKAVAAEKLVRSRASIVDDVQPATRTSRDPDDDWILSIAATSASDCLVTGDDDLLSLKRYQDTEIVRPSDFWEFEIRMQKS
ncbi:MAG TPA: putative toxin-antitoxin system toxin component, PIN family [Rhodothermales bacterium]|nr:putative toxin-antitoxin system toxin component, PIN family [Rhodothermales bacterium]